MNRILLPDSVYDWRKMSSLLILSGHLNWAHQPIFCQFLQGKPRFNQIQCLTHSVVDYQLSTNGVYVAASTNQKRNIISLYVKCWRRKSSLWCIQLASSCCGPLRWSVLVSSNPPVPVLVGRLSLVPSCRVITVGRLVVKCCTSPNPAIKSFFKVKAA